MKRKKIISDFYIAEHGAHACSYNENKEEYEAPSINFKHICERKKTGLHKPVFIALKRL